MNPAEARSIQGRTTHARLDEFGYGHVSLEIDDRRLKIVNTNLEELNPVWLQRSVPSAGNQRRDASSAGATG